MPVPIEVNELIQTSGNNFHAKVARWFVSHDWHVIVSPYYMDQTLGKAREIDLIAEKTWFIPGPFGKPAGTIAIRLFVECKFVATYSIFWFADKNMNSAKELVCSSGVFRADNTYTNKHHYLSSSPRVAKLFATSNSKQFENEPFYKALNQVLNAMVSMRGQQVSTSSQTGSGITPSEILQFPVVICNSFDKIYGVDFYAESVPEPIHENFQLEVQYAYHDRYENQRDDYFLLDFVSYDKLDLFSAALDADGKAAAALASNI